MASVLNLELICPATTPLSSNCSWLREFVSKKFLASHLALADFTYEAPIRDTFSRLLNLDIDQDWGSHIAEVPWLPYP
jgi:hypothetical protein